MNSARPETGADFYQTMWPSGARFGGRSTKIWSVVVKAWSAKAFGFHFPQ